MASPTVSVKRPAGLSATVCATAAIANAMPVHEAGRCSSSTTSTGIERSGPRKKSNPAKRGMLRPADNGRHE